MPAHRLQEEIPREPGRERSRREIKRIDAEHIMMRLVADGWARAEISVRILYVQAADEAPRGARTRPFGKAVHHWGNVVGQEMHQAEALAAVSIKDDDGKALRAESPGEATVKEGVAARVMALSAPKIMKAARIESFAAIPQCRRAAAMGFLIDMSCLRGRNRSERRPCASITMMEAPVNAPPAQ